ncbi:MAG: hypothetical protein II504_02200, partial [Clostridia bacterium]|nr:hypothetical protein [Clostridia bacterium]
NVDPADLWLVNSGLVFTSPRLQSWVIDWTDVHISKAGSAGTTGTAGCQSSSETAEKEQMVSEK